ncbi:MAG: hypothetical protein D6718_01635 [Acidobacteria bacterium]|nr:MAG: hypothetical protein D6718_01635 [Acidobacteriota bacterium]
MEFLPERFTLAGLPRETFPKGRRPGSLAGAFGPSGTGPAFSRPNGPPDGPAIRRPRSARRVRSPFEALSYQGQPALSDLRAGDPTPPAVYRFEVS